MSGQSGLTVRRSRRHEIALPARVRVAEIHTGLVRLGPAAPAREGWVDVDVIDFGLGGLGMVSPLYFPRRVILEIHVLAPEGDAERVLVETRVRVHRSVMTDRRPAYLLGTAFEEMTDVGRRQVESVVARLEGASRRAAG